MHILHEEPIAIWEYLALSLSPIPLSREHWDCDGREAMLSIY
jgi:hypothetical protein